MRRLPPKVASVDASSRLPAPNALLLSTQPAMDAIPSSPPPDYETLLPLPPRSPTSTLTTRPEEVEPIPASPPLPQRPVLLTRITSSASDELHEEEFQDEEVSAFYLFFASSFERNEEKLTALYSIRFEGTSLPFFVPSPPTNLLLNSTSLSHPPPRQLQLFSYSLLFFSSQPSSISTLRLERRDPVLHHRRSNARS